MIALFKSKTTLETVVTRYRRLRVVTYAGMSHVLSPVDLAVGDTFVDGDTSDVYQVHTIDRDERTAKACVRFRRMTKYASNGERYVVPTDEFSIVGINGLKRFSHYDCAGHGMSLAPNWFAKKKEKKEKKKDGRSHRDKTRGREEEERQQQLPSVADGSDAQMADCESDGSAKKRESDEEVRSSSSSGESRQKQKHGEAEAGSSSDDDDDDDGDDASFEVVHSLRDIDDIRPEYLFEHETGGCIACDIVVVAATAQPSLRQNREMRVTSPATRSPASWEKSQRPVQTLQQLPPHPPLLPLPSPDGITPPPPPPSIIRQHPPPQLTSPPFGKRRKTAPESPRDVPVEHSDVQKKGKDDDRICPGIFRAVEDRSSPSSSNKFTMLPQ